MLKKAKKKQISLIINKIIPNFSPNWIRRVCFPMYVASRTMSRHHWNIDNNILNLPNRSRVGLLKWNKLINPNAISIALIAEVIGQGRLLHGKVIDVSHLHTLLISDAVTKSRISVNIGITIRLSTSNNRNSPLFKFRSCVINESNIICGKSLYSYLQYYWWPMILIVITGWSSSSIKYIKRRDGKASDIKIILGIIVQISSVLWASFIVRF